MGWPHCGQAVGGEAVGGGAAAIFTLPAGAWSRPVVRLKQRLRLAQPGPITWRQQAVVAYLHPSASLRAGSSPWEHMLEKALDERCRRQRLGAPTAGVASAVAEGNLALLRLENPVVAQRHAEDVGRQVLEAASPLPTGRQSTTQSCCHTADGTWRKSPLFFSVARNLARISLANGLTWTKKWFLARSQR